MRHHGAHHSKSTDDQSKQRYSHHKSEEMDSETKYILVAGTVLDGVGGIFQPGFVEILDDNKIGRVGKLSELGKIPKDRVKDYGKEACITPGLVDSHSHTGLVRSGGNQDDINECSELTALGSAMSGIWSDSFEFNDCLKAGTTTQFIIPGSCDIMGGFGYCVKNNSAKPTVERIMNETIGIKLAFGENPKRKHNNQLIDSRQKEQAILIEILNALKTGDSQMKYIVEQPGFAKAHQLVRENKEIYFHAHCYTTDDIIQVITAFEQVFGTEGIGPKLVLHHATEAYRIRKYLYKRRKFIKGIAGWFDWGSFKIEADGWTFLNGAFLLSDKINFAMTSDIDDNIRIMRQACFLAQKADKSGISLPFDIALQMVTSIPAKLTRSSHRIGQLTSNYDADVVVWSTNPLNSPYANPLAVYVDSQMMFDYTIKRPLPITPYGLGRIKQSDYSFTTQTEKIWYHTGIQGKLSIYSRPPNYSNEDMVITNVAIFTGDGQTWYETADLILHKQTGTLNFYQSGSVPIGDYKNFIDGTGRCATPLLSETFSGIGLYVDAYNNDESRLRQFGDARTFVDITSPYFLTLLSNYGVGSAHITSEVDGSRGRFFAFNLDGSAYEVNESDNSSTILYNIINLKFGESVQKLLAFLSSDDSNAQNLITGTGFLLIGVNSAVNIREALRIAKKYPQMKVGLVGATSAWRFTQEIKDLNVFVMRNQQYSIVELDDIPNDIGILLANGVKTLISGVNDGVMTKLLLYAIEAIVYGANPHQVLNSVTSKPWEIFTDKTNIITDDGDGSLVIWPGKAPFSGPPDEKFINGKLSTLISRPDLLAERFK